MNRFRSDDKITDDRPGQRGVNEGHYRVLDTLPIRFEEAGVVRAIEIGPESGVTAVKVKSPSFVKPMIVTTQKPFHGRVLAPITIESYGSETSTDADIIFWTKPPAVLLPQAGAAAGGIAVFDRTLNFGDIVFADLRAFEDLIFVLVAGGTWDGSLKMEPSLDGVNVIVAAGAGIAHGDAIMAGIPFRIRETTTASTFEIATPRVPYIKLSASGTVGSVRVIIMGKKS